MVEQPTLIVSTDKVQILGVICLFMLAVAQLVRAAGCDPAGGDSSSLG